MKRRSSGFYREKDRFRLEPANSTMKPIYSNNVKVLGVVVGVVPPILTAFRRA